MTNRPGVLIQGSAPRGAGPCVHLETGRLLVFQHESAPDGKTASPQTADKSMKPVYLTLATLAGILALSTARADTGLYLRAEVGANLAGELMLGSRDSDRASYCDEFVNPRYSVIPDCVSPNRGIGAVDAWTSNFDAGTGLLGAVAFGKQIGSIWRIELEYFNRRVRLDQTAAIISPSGRPYADLFGAELPNAEEHVRDVSAQGLFANLLVDLPRPDAWSLGWGWAWARRVRRSTTVRCGGAAAIPR